MASLCSLEVLKTVQQIRFWVVFVQISLSQGVYIAGYPWNGYPLCVQRDAAPSGWKPTRGSVLFRLWLCCSRRPRPYRHWHLAYALPKRKMLARRHILIYRTVV